MAACRIHYEIYDNEDDKLLKLTEDNLDRLKEAKKCRFELGGSNIHVTQCNNIHVTQCNNIHVTQCNNIPDKFDKE